MCLRDWEASEESSEGRTSWDLTYLAARVGILSQRYYNHFAHVCYFEQRFHNFPHLKDGCDLRKINCRSWFNVYCTSTLPSYHGWGQMRRLSLHCGLVELPSQKGCHLSPSNITRPVRKAYAFVFSLVFTRLSSVVICLQFLMMQRQGFWPQVLCTCAYSFCLLEIVLCAFCSPDLTFYRNSVKVLLSPYSDDVFQKVGLNSW
jgi:hypothetical protein